ncbi:PEX5 [Sanghuangporus weigelae]
MSLQGLISGSECALPNNPLAQVLKHTDGDHSVQRDRVAGPSSSRLQHLPSASANNVSEGDMTMARHFFDTRAPDMQSVMQPNHSYMMELAHRMNNMNVVGPQIQSQMQPNTELQDMWIRAEMQKLSGAPQASGWTSEFGKVQSILHAQDQISSPQTNSPQDVMENTYNPSSLYRPMGMGMGLYNASFPQSFSPMQDQGKGKAKARDDAFEAAFAQFELPSQTTSARIEEVSEGTVSLSEADKVMERFMQRHRNADEEPEELSTAEWEADLQRYLQSERKDIDFDNLDYGAALREAWENGLGKFDDDAMPPGMKFNDEGVPLLEHYAFDNENKYLASPEGPSCLERAKTLLENNGSLTEAALLLEAAIQKGELGEGGYEAWILLGETRCMDEREEAGMRALMEGSRRAEEAGARGVGLLTLATAFTNEGYERGSHTMLLRWLRARYPVHAPSEEDAASWLRQSHWASREHVTDAFLAVARAQHVAGVVDADVQVGLGILFYTNGDFERAKDCFSAALAVNPRDYLLWNRYGSALSNGNKPEEALGAYREALRLRPTYTRAIYNVGVACLNIGADKEAAEHFLSALSMQESASGDKSEQLWFTLRRALIQMGREDLANKAQPGGDLAAFRAEGFDF